MTELVIDDVHFELTEDTLNIVEKVRFANFKLDFASFHSHFEFSLFNIFISYVSIFYFELAPEMGLIR